jgi:hypothetical protein
MLLNLLSQVSFLAFQQVFNTGLFVTKDEPFYLSPPVIHTFENT